MVVNFEVHMGNCGVDNIYAREAGGHHWGVLFKTRLLSQSISSLFTTTSKHSSRVQCFIATATHNPIYIQSASVPNPSNQILLYVFEPLKRKPLTAQPIPTDGVYQCNKIIRETLRRS